MKRKEIKVTYVYDKDTSEEDQKMVDKAFDVLFNVVYEKYWKNGHKTEKKK